MPRAGGREEWGVTATGYNVSFGDAENVKLVEVLVAQIYEYTKTHLVVHFTCYVNYLSIKVLPKKKSHLFSGPTLSTLFRLQSSSLRSSAPCSV